MAEGLTRRDFLRLSAGAGAGAGALTLVPPVTRMAEALQAPRQVGPLRAGVGVTDLTPGNGGTFFGYVRPDRTANGVAVRLFARAVVLDDGRTRLALLTVDLGASVAGWARGSIGDVSTNRSLAAHLANHGLDVPVHEGELEMDPDGPDHPRDLNIRLLRVERPSGEPVTGWGLFAVHPTNFPNTNTLFSGDLSGLAVRRFEASFGSGTGAVAVPAGPGGAPVGVLANGNEGDLISLYASYNPHSCADLMGLRLGRKLRALWDAAGADLSSRVPLGRRWTRIRYEGQEVEPDRRVADRALWGVSFLGGAENGPSPFYEAGTEGTRRPAELADPVHGRKVIAGPAPWRTDPELQLLRIGSTLLTALPGEATTEAGRRIDAAALGGAPDGVDDAAIVGLANDYVGYFTTPEEYDQQHYEGGHTVFGKWTTLLVVRGAGQLSDALASGEDAPPPDVDPLPEYPPQGGAGGGVGAGAASGEIRAQPPCEVPRLGVADIAWDGGPDGLDRPVGGPFVLLERRDPDGAWTAVDSDLGVAFQWTEEDGRYLARHEIARGQASGTYRLRVTAARYELTSEPFEVVANTGLIVRGVEADTTSDGIRLTFRAQNPPPGVDVHLRHREQVPTGGTLTFTHDGTSHEAVWDAQVGGWVAEVPGDATGGTVEVPDGGLVDDVGNRSGPGGSFTVAEVADVRWPPDMAVGGTDRDWHGHRPSEAEVGRDGECADGAPGEDVGDGRDGGPSAAGGATPATGGGTAVAGAVALGAAVAGATTRHRGEGPRPGPDATGQQ